ncbi:MAG: helix-turn-helix domain-containing protein [Thermomicrobiales bacterium]
MNGEFGPYLRQFRTEVGLTQQELAAKTGISVRCISDLERGINLSPRPSTVRRLYVGLELPEQQRYDLMAAAESARSLVYGRNGRERRAELRG